MTWNPPTPGPWTQASLMLEKLSSMFASMRLNDGNWWEWNKPMDEMKHFRKLWNILLSDCSNVVADADKWLPRMCVWLLKHCQVQCINQPGVLPSSSALKLLPLLVLAALKSPAFRCVWKPTQHCSFNNCFGSSRPGLKLDERSAALIQMKCLPLASAIQTLYPDMYRWGCSLLIVQYTFIPQAKEIEAVVTSVNFQGGCVGDRAHAARWRWGWWTCSRPSKASTFSWEGILQY